MKKRTSTLLIGAVAGIMVAGALAVALPSVAFASDQKQMVVSEALVELAELAV